MPSRISQARSLSKYFLLVDNMLVVLGYAPSAEWLNPGPDVNSGNNSADSAGAH